jgi:hypothetical protein
VSIYCCHFRQTRTRLIGAPQALLAESIRGKHDDWKRAFSSVREDRGRPAVLIAGRAPGESGFSILNFCFNDGAYSARRCGKASCIFAERGRCALADM